MGSITNTGGRREPVGQFMEGTGSTLSPMCRLLPHSGNCWPEFVQHDGGVFLRELFDSSTYIQWKERLGTDTTAIERVVDHVHIYDLFLNPKLRTPGPGAVLYLAGLLGKLWSLRAAEEFGPGQIVVDMLDEDPPGTDPVLVLYQDVPAALS